MTAILKVELEHRPTERAEGDLLVAGFFEGDRPLRGSVGRVDWRVCGLISKALLEDRIAGRVGECLLLPTEGRLRVPLALAIGLGLRSDYDSERLFECTRMAVERALDLGARRVVLEPPGISAETLPGHAGNLMEAVLAPLRDREETLTLRFLIPLEEAAPVAAALRTAILRQAPGEAALVRPQRRSEPGRALAPAPRVG
ncbi:MAG: M17 family peptidase N-terminal domain-containing protein [Myxococcota bacterium]